MGYADFRRSMNSPGATAKRLPVRSALLEWGLDALNRTCRSGSCGNLCLRHPMGAFGRARTLARALLARTQRVPRPAAAPVRPLGQKDELWRRKDEKRPSPRTVLSISNRFRFPARRVSPFFSTRDGGPAICAARVVTFKNNGMVLIRCTCTFRHPLNTPYNQSASTASLKRTAQTDGAYEASIRYPPCPMF